MRVRGEREREREREGGGRGGSSQKRRFHTPEYKAARTEMSPPFPVQIMLMKNNGFKNQKMHPDNCK